MPRRRTIDEARRCWLVGVIIGVIIGAWKLDDPAKSKITALET